MPPPSSGGAAPGWYHPWDGLPRTAGVGGGAVIDECTYPEGPSRRLTSPGAFTQTRPLRSVVS